MPTRVDNGTLTPNTVYSSVFNEYFDLIEVSNFDSTGRVYVRTDGVDPVIGADDCYVVGPGEAITITNDKARPTQGGGAVTTDVRLISAVACDFSVSKGGN